MSNMDISFSDSVRRRRVGIIDLGVGNTRSVERAIERLGLQSTTTSDADALEEFDRIILPGVGSFDAVMAAIDRLGMPNALRAFIGSAEHRILGICIGMHVLFEGSEEGNLPGLGLIPGSIRRLRDSSGASHINIGWSRLTHLGSEPMDGASESDHAARHLGPFYFVHEYAYDAKSADVVTMLAPSQVGPIPAIIRHQNLWGTQFHPEKSGRDGRGFLRHFIEGEAE